MKISYITDSDELPNFDSHSQNVLFDKYLWEFINQVKTLSIKNDNPYLPQVLMDQCLKKIELYFDEHGPLQI